MNGIIRGIAVRTSASLLFAFALLSGPMRHAMAEVPTDPPILELAQLEPEELGALDIEQLSQVRIVSATLTPTPTRLVPAKTTVLDEATIAQSGARNLNEALEIHAPNTQLILHNTHLDHFGIRGIISDRDDKYLLRINDKVMNNLFFVGAQGERDLLLLGDFRTASLVHGPASATYGPGALAGVLNLETHTGLTFEGDDARVRQGFGEEFTAVEFRSGRKYSADSGLFLYAGIADRNGADQDRSPYVFGSSFATSGEDVVSGESVGSTVPNLHDGGQYLQMKYHASYVDGPFEVWTRYTQGGVVTRPMRTTLETVDLADTEAGRENFDRQFTVATKYVSDVSETVRVESLLSYDWYEFRLWLYDLYADSDGRMEEEAYGRVLATWTPNDAQSVAFGVELSRLWFDGPPVGYGPSPGVPPVNDRWSADTLSLFAEHQWRLSEKWTTFASARSDKHTYSDWLFSPRLAAVFAPGAQDTYKLIAARAVRRGGDGELRQEHVQTGDEGTREILDSLEFRYERQHDANWHAGISTFVERNDAIGFDQTANRSVAVGKFEIWGVEPEITYGSRTTRLTLSHGYTQLRDASLATTTTVQGISAEPYGFGSDLANWSNHITKLAVIHDLNERWTATTSLRAYWGFPGAADLANWNGSLTSPTSLALDDPGYDDAYGPTVLWNAGLEHHPGKHLTIRADAFNIMGWFDKTLNKRLYYQRGSDYSIEAAAIALSARYTF